MYDFTLVALEGAFGSGVAASVDILRSASALAPRVAAPAPKWRICSVHGGPIALQSGIRVETTKIRPASRNDRSTWVVPGLGLNTELEVRASAERADVRALLPLLKGHAQAGGKVAAACSSVFLLGFAGLLTGKRVTTTWWLAPLLQRMNPECKVDAARMVCADGHIVSAGAAFAQTDLMLHLLRAAFGPRLVESLSRFLLVDARQAQSNYVIPEVLANGDELVARIVSRVEKSLPTMPSVASLAKDFRVAERTLARHVQRATGQSTRALLQSVRLGRARALLEQSRMTVEQVAAAVGYGDPTALRRLMRKRSGVSPSQFRPALTMAIGGMGPKQDLSDT
jgi:transcriptional regulator GlxA family with amidase domain